MSILLLRFILLWHGLCVSLFCTAVSSMKVDRCLLKEYPKGPLSPTNFQFDCVEAPTELQDGQVRIQLRHISVDPYMRTRFQPGPGYIMPGFEIDQPIQSICVAEVLESKHEDYSVGSLVTGFLPWVTQQVVPEPSSSLQQIPQLEDVPSTYFLGVLGLTGLSAYLPFKHYAKEYLTKKAQEEGEGPVVFVSGAAGAVGSVFGQLAKNQIPSSIVYGSAGSKEKIDVCKSTFGFDNAFNYKEGIAAGLDTMLQGRTIDLYFDNVGGEMLDEVLPRMTKGGKIICCGSISVYDEKEEDKYRLKNQFSIVAKCLNVQGFLLGQWMSELGSAREELGQLLAEGKVIPQETVLNGFDKVVEGMMGLLEGKNTGKMVITV